MSIAVLRHDRPTLREWQARWLSETRDPAKLGVGKYSPRVRNLISHVAKLARVLMLVDGSGGIDLDRVTVEIENCPLLHVCDKSYAGNYDAALLRDASTGRVVMKITFNEPVWPRRPGSLHRYHVYLSDDDDPVASFFKSEDCAAWVNGNR